MSYNNFSETFNAVKADLQWAQTYIPPVAEIFTANSAAPVGLTKDGRTVQWMRNVQSVVAGTLAAMGAIAGSFPGVVAGQFAKVLNENIVTTIQRTVTFGFANAFFPNDDAASRINRGLFTDSFAMNSSPEAVRAARSAFGKVVRVFANATGAVGLVVGSAVSSIVVPPVSGTANVVEYLVRKM